MIVLVPRADARLLLQLHLPHLGCRRRRLRRHLGRLLLGVRRMRSAKASRAFHGWRLAVERGMLGVRVETLTRMLYDAQDTVVGLCKLNAVDP